MNKYKFKQEEGQLQTTVPHQIHTTPPPQGVCLQLCKPKLPISLPPPLSRCQVPDAGIIVEKLVIARMLCTIHFWISVSLQLLGMDKMGSELSAFISNGILKCSASDSVLLPEKIAHSIKDVLLHLHSSLAISASQALLASTAGSSWL